MDSLTQSGKKRSRPKKDKSFQPPPEEEPETPKMRGRQHQQSPADEKWGPQLEQGTYKNRQRLYLSEQTDGSVPNDDKVVMDPSNLEFVASKSIHSAAKVNMYSRMDILTIISEHLPKTDYLNVLSGMFGPIATMFEQQLKLAIQLIHFFIVHEVNTSKKHEMWFDISGNVCRFSLKEFAAVTGLDCKDSDDYVIPEVDMADELGVPSCTLTDLVKHFTTCNDSQRKISLAYLLIVEGVLLPHRHKSIRDHFYKLSTDMAQFSKYPWGREVYSATIESLKKASRSEHSTGARSETRLSYYLFGYPLAFQVWILESFPQFRDLTLCATEGRKQVPYLVRWYSSVPKPIMFSSVQTFVASRKMDCRYPSFNENEMFKHLNFSDEVKDKVLDDFAQVLMNKARDNRDTVVDDGPIVPRPKKDMQANGVKRNRASPRGKAVARVTRALTAEAKQPRKVVAVQKPAMVGRGGSEEKGAPKEPDWVSKIDALSEKVGTLCGVMTDFQSKFNGQGVEMDNFFKKLESILKAAQSSAMTVTDMDDDTQPEDQESHPPVDNMVESVEPVPDSEDDKDEEELEEEEKEEEELEEELGFPLDLNKPYQHI